MSNPCGNVMAYLEESKAFRWTRQFALALIVQLNTCTFHTFTVSVFQTCRRAQEVDPLWVRTKTETQARHGKAKPHEFDD